MLQLPEEYITALESVLGIALQESRLEDHTAKKSLLGFATPIAKLSERLTQERDQVGHGKYFLDAQLQRAYLLYFMSTNLLKLWPALRELSLMNALGSGDGTLRMLDLGSGPGTSVWSTMLYLLEERPEIHQLAFTLSDKHESNLRDAEKFYHALRRSASAKLSGKLTALPEFQTLDLRFGELKAFAMKRSASFDLITLMNVLNELPEQDDEKLIEILLELLSDNGAIVLIEPSTRELSRRAIRFRELAIHAGGFIFSPCTHSAHCHALDKETDWCHTEIPWKRPKFIELLDDETGLLRLSLKSTYFTIRKRSGNVGQFGQFGQRVQAELPKGNAHSEPLPESHRVPKLPEPLELHRLPELPEQARIVSELFKEKGRVRAILCDESGRREHVLNLRDRSLENRAFTEAARYDLVVTTGVIAREHDSKVEVGTAFHRVLDASGARIVDK